MARGRVVVVGSVNMDHSVRVQRLPAAGETVLGQSYVLTPGGKGANQAAAAARLSALTSIIGVRGSDPAGEELAAVLAAEGVDVTRLRVSPRTPTGLALITVDAAGDNTIVVAPLANAELRPEEVDDAVDLIAGAAVLVTQLEVPLDAVTRALELARGSGVTTILTPSPARPAPRLAALLPLVDVIVPNETEASVLTGVADPEQAARRLVAQGPQSAVVTLGRAGALWFDGAILRQIPAFPVDEVDPTAAGDAFCGALAAALADGRSMAEGLDWAAAAGAHAVSRPGALTSLPTREDISGRLVSRPDGRS
jgi:ribokinase